MNGYAQEMSADNDQENVFRLSPIIVNAQAYTGDANSTVAQELWVGGKVATSILDTLRLSFCDYRKGNRTAKCQDH